MNENNVNNNVQNGMGGMPNVNAGGVPPVNNVNTNQGVMPNVNIVDSSQNVAAVPNPVDMNQSVAQNTNAVGINQGVAPTVNPMNMNQGVMPNANSVNQNVNPMNANQGVMPNVNSMGMNQNVNPVDMNQGIAPGVSPMNMNQGAIPNTAPVNQGIVSGGANNVQPPKKKKSASSIIIFILFIAAVVGGGFYFYKMYFEKDNKPVNVDNSTPAPTVNESSSGSETTSGIQTGGSVTVGGYTYSVPDNLFYQVQDDTIFVSDSGTASTYVIGALPLVLSYDEIKGNTDGLKSSLTAQGLTVEDLKVSTVGNREYILSSVTLENNPMVLAVTKLDDKNLMLMKVLVVSEDALKNSFAAIEDVLSNLKAVGNSSGDSASVKIEDSLKNFKNSDFSIQNSKVGIDVLK